MSANVSEPPEPVAEREPERVAESPVASGSVPATPAIRQAIEEILRINKDLEWVLLEMEKALETLEEAEVQKYADEREIESLKNAMRQLGRTREAVQRVQQGGQRRPDNPRGPRPRHGDRDRGREHREHRERREQRHQSHHHAEHHEEHAERSDASASSASHEPESHSEIPPEPEIPV